MFISKKKYNEAIEQHSTKSWNEGFETGIKKAVVEARKVFVKKIQKEIAEVSSLSDKEFIDGLERSIDIIRSRK